MNERETVTEVVAAVAVRVDVPTVAGGDLPDAVTERLVEIEFVRHVTDVEVSDVEPGDGTLHVTVETQLTAHFPAGEVVDADTARTRLSAAEPVAEILEFEVIAGPYGVERW